METYILESLEHIDADLQDLNNNLVRSTLRPKFITVDKVSNSTKYEVTINVASIAMFEETVIDHNKNKKYGTSITLMNGSTLICYNKYTDVVKMINDAYDQEGVIV